MGIGNILGMIVVLLAGAVELHATSCVDLMPCQRVAHAVVLFAGTVADPGIPPDRKVRFEVHEVFAGLPLSTKEVVIRASEDWLHKGESYLIDARRNEQGHLLVFPCKGSEKLDSKEGKELAAYLRQVKQGSAKSSLTVRVHSAYTAIAGVNVSISGPSGASEGVTDADGAMRFYDIKPGKYLVSVAKDKYKLDTEAFFNQTEPAVNFGACAEANVAIKSESRVSGLARDVHGEPIPGLAMQMIPVPDPASGERTSQLPGFNAETDKNGAFVFDAVLPGRYHLGVNLDGHSPSLIPKTYYPGQQSINNAIPIEVKPGESIADLFFTPPDFGRKRQIEICVVDEAGAPVANTKIESSFTDRRVEIGVLGRELFTGTFGCVIAQGYSAVPYGIAASTVELPIQRRPFQVSEPVLIGPGDKPVRQVLVLKKAFNAGK